MCAIELYCNLDFAVCDIVKCLTGTVGLTAFVLRFATNKCCNGLIKRGVQAHLFLSYIHPAGGGAMGKSAILHHSCIEAIATRKIVGRVAVSF